MRKVISSVHTTLDGYIQGPRGELDWLHPLDERGEEDIAKMLEDEVDTILLGRVTWEGFQHFWPTAEGYFASLMNRHPKIVFSNPGSVEEVAWGDRGNISLVNEDVPGYIRELKQRRGKDMVILASGGLVSSLLGHGLVDELRIQVHPVVIGSGKPLFQDIRHNIGLTLANAKPYPSGSTLLTFVPK